MRIHQDRQLRLTKHVDESRRHHHAVRVDGAAGGRIRSLPMAAIFPASDGDVARVPRRAGAIDDAAVADHQVVGAGSGSEQQDRQQEWHRSSIDLLLCFGMVTGGFHAAERAVFRRLGTPEKIQRFLDDLAYNKEHGGETCRSPRRVLRDRTAHCMEGALFGAAALRMIGHPPLLLDLEAVRDDDHVLAIFQERGHWGAVAKSNYSGLRYREPVYRTLRELAMSYFEHYYNLRKEKTLRNYSRPVNLKRFDSIGWMTAEEDYSF